MVGFHIGVQVKSAYSQGTDDEISRPLNLHTVIAFLWGLTCSELGVLSALLRELSESESIKHVCISKSRYHEIKKSLLGMIDLRQKTYTRKTTGKTVWSLRETDRFGIISGVNEKV